MKRPGSSGAFFCKKALTALFAARAAPIMDKGGLADNISALL